MMKSNSPEHVYIHIPFCTNKCYYCDFNIFVWQGDDWVNKYLDALECEMMLWVKKTPPQRLKTVYIGGGTPSLLNESQLEHLLALIGKYFPIDENSYEMTLEVNPGTLTSEKARILKEGGVNRLSIGVQTFNDELLKKIGRKHTGAEAIHVVEMAREAGFTNLSLDLIYGLPEQSLADLKRSLDIIDALQIEHLSVYNLKVEENTLFGLWLRQNRLPLPSEELEVEMYNYLIDRLAAIGLEQYEISNFARQGYESKHNMAYWLTRSYYGIGAGAHGYIDQERYENIGPIRPYMKATQEGLPILQKTSVSRDEQIEEMLFLGLRLNKGISFEKFHSMWGLSLHQRYGDEIEQLVQQGLLEADHEGIRLTRSGRLLSNEVFMRFLKD